MDHPVDLETLKTFEFDRILSESTTTGSIYLLGKLHNESAIIHLQRTILSADGASELVKHGLEEIKVFLDNRPYFSAHALLARSTSSLPDLQIKLIWPATEIHIAKYTLQERVMVSETAEKYAKVVVPYIESFPPDRIQWVYNILEGKKEADRVLYRDDDPSRGFLILPDLKWDQTSMTALYLVVLVQDRTIRSLRDLTRDHVPLLRRIRQQAFITAKEVFNVEPNKLRLFIHYQPSYYHFHVHVVHIDHENLSGMMVGQARLLEDIISLSILQQMTLTYALGVEHGLYASFLAASN
ncbi:HIT-like domain-containing protein [Kockovaella imperatae]|uniref:HIT-like domain-containing protein n=1 Tax=Kockovaella imperatae TaxID=4999 RepID=A0A1Y1UGF5_9TREE|nr:HIT-like domain-containing protein [Kockovaella imperatae]ORX37150.1 HIT-like domain-containing protein [Kockovaella imperatae]